MKNVRAITSRLCVWRAAVLCATVLVSLATFPIPLRAAEQPRKDASLRTGDRRSEADFGDANKGVTCFIWSVSRPAATSEGGVRKGSLGEQFDITGKFIVSMVSDGQGGAWIGTEDFGVYHLDPKAEEGKKWKQYTTKDGLGDDNAYALALDKMGRLWVGHLNHGVSVFNGKQWRTYDVPDGPIGERIFDVKCCPRDGDVWIATSAGLTRYCLDGDSWSHYTRVDGLPEDQANSIAFDKSGNIYVGTQCHGIARARAAADKDGMLEYKTWSIVSSPDRFGPSGVSPVPLDPTGAGLPTNLINQIIVGRDGTVWVATTAGLAWSRDSGRSWRYVRGRDYAGKVKGLYGGPPRGWKQASASVMHDLLPADYVTCLAEDGSGAMWLGFRQAGYVVIDPKTNKRLRGTKESGGLQDNYISAIQPMPDHRPMIASYMGGLIRSEEVAQFGPNSFAPPTPVRVLAENAPPLPTPAGVPTLPDLNALLAELGKTQPENHPDRPAAVALPDDWTTQGDWLGRVGRFWADLCAIRSPYSYFYGVGCGEPVKCVEMIGSNTPTDDSVRYWVHWLYSENRRVLEMPPPYFASRVALGLAKPGQNRRQAEVDDHGESMPMNVDGPHLFFTLRVPPGDYVLSLYFFNKDGHTGMNRFRDYLVQVKDGRFTEVGYGDTPTAAEVVRFEREPCLASARVQEFWGGVYKRFYVRGGGWYSIKVDRNHSHNTICSAVMLDLVDEQPPPYYWPDLPWARQVKDWIRQQLNMGLTGWKDEYLAERQAVEQEARDLLLREQRTRPADYFRRFAPVTTTGQAARWLFEETQWQRLRNVEAWAKFGRKAFLPLTRYWRHTATDGDPYALRRLATSWYEIAQYEQWESQYEALGLPTARMMEMEKQNSLIKIYRDELADRAREQMKRKEIER